MKTRRPGRGGVFFYARGKKSVEKASGAGGARPQALSREAAGAPPFFARCE